MTSIGDHGVVDIDSSISLETTCYAMACFHGTGAQHWNQVNQTTNFLCFVSTSLTFEIFSIGNLPFVL